MARTHRNLYPKLHLASIRYNIRYQKSSALHWAARTDNDTFAKTLLYYQADINALVGDMSPLMVAAVHDAELVAGLLLQQKGLRVNKRNADGKCALWHSVAAHSSTVTNRLLQDARVKIDRLNHEGQTPFWLAVFQGNRWLVDLLLSKGANLNAMDRIGILPWIQACIRNKNSIIDLMLNHLKATSPDVCSLGIGPAKEEETVLSAAMNGNIAALQKLLLGGEHLDVVDHCEQTPLHLAARRDHVAMVDFLLRRDNSLLNRKDSYGRTALWLSTYSNCDTVTKRLLKERGMELNTLGRDSRDGTPSTPLHHLMMRLDTMMLRQFLAMSSLDPNLCAHSQSPLCLAVEEGNISVMRLLIAHERTQINAICPHSDSPLLLATEKGHFDMVKLLVGQGSRLQVNQLNRLDEETALSVAIRQGRLDIAGVLLSHPDIDLDVTNRWGETALLLAVRQEKIDIVEKLLQSPKIPRKLALAADAAGFRKIGGKGSLMEAMINQRDTELFRPGKGGFDHICPRLTIFTSTGVTDLHPGLHQVWNRLA